MTRPPIDSVPLAMADFLVSLLGQVARYGVQADDAVVRLVHRVIDEFSISMSRQTGISMDFMQTFKSEVVKRVMTGRCTSPHPCQGRTKNGIPCKRKTYTEFCADHQDQSTSRVRHLQGTQPKKCTGIIRPMRFEF